jgi:uncharacterized membrane protein YhiD involved in acid resistance
MQTDKWGMFQKFLIAENANISVTDFLINALILVILGFVLELTYRKCGKSLSNRKNFAANFILLSFATMLIIVTVKSSLALSLGLVGALSIVRFRAAIKEPEELLYLFVAISLGLVLGANQRVIALMGFGVIMLIIWVRFFFTKQLTHQNLFLTVKTPEQGSVELKEVVDLVSKTFKSAELKRYSESPSGLDVSFLIESKNPELLQKFHDELKEKYDGIRVNFLENLSI